MDPVPIGGESDVVRLKQLRARRRPPVAEAAEGAVAGEREDPATGAKQIFVVETRLNRVRLLDFPSGRILPFAGDGTLGSFGDGGPATSAQLFQPYDVALSPDGNWVYICGSQSIRVVERTSGTIMLVSTAVPGATGCAIGPDGALYVADTIQQRVARVGPLPCGPAMGMCGIITVAGVPNQGGFNGDGPVATVKLQLPMDVAFRPNGAMLITEQGTGQGGARVRQVLDGAVTTVAGGGSLMVDGPATAVRLQQPFGVAAHADGSVYVAEQGGNRIRRIAGGQATTVATMPFASGVTLFDGKLWGSSDSGQVVKAFSLASGPTLTPTQALATATSTSVPPTATRTSVPPTATASRTATQTPLPTCLATATPQTQCVPGA